MSAALDAGGAYVAEKLCCKCKQTKPLSEFRRDVKKSLGVKSYCKECGREMDRAWYAANPAKRRRNEAKKTARRRRGLELLRRSEEAGIVKTGGKHLSDAYREVRLSLEGLEKELAKERAIDRKREIEAAMQALYRAEDAIIRASKLSSPR